MGASGFGAPTVTAPQPATAALGPLARAQLAAEQKEPNYNPEPPKVIKGGFNRPKNDGNDDSGQVRFLPFICF